MIPEETQNDKIDYLKDQILHYSRPNIAHTEYAKRLRLQLSKELRHLQFQKSLMID